MQRRKTGKKRQEHQVNIDRIKFLTLDVSAPTSILITFVVMAALVAIVSFFNVPNPNMILIAGLVVCSAILGYPGGITAGLIMLGYTLFFFSTDNDFMTFTEQNVQKVIVSTIGIAVVAFFVSYLKYLVSSTLEELNEMTNQLEEDNRLLEQASTSDLLTGTRNRFGLRRDFPGYVGKNLHVSMIDLDNFKKLNDAHGHNTGDLVLKRIGERLVEYCTQDNVYRYGGDEFLIILTDLDSRAFNEKMHAIKKDIEAIEIEGIDIPMQFSAGYVYGNPSSQSDLRLMIRQADMNLYASKDSGRNLITGGKFSRTIAESAKPHRTHLIDRD